MTQKFVADEWWREAILLYAAKADASAPLSEALAAESPVAWSLAWQLLAEAARLEPDTRARADAKLCEALRSRDPIRFLPAARAHHDLRMREWTPTADGARCRKTPVSNAEYQLFLLQGNPSERWPLVPPHWRKDSFCGEPEEPVLGVLPWQAERLVESLQGNDNRIVTALPRGTNELSANFAGFTIWSSKWDLLFLTEPQTPNLVLTMPQHSMLWFALARDPALARALDLALARDLARALTGGRASDTHLTRVLALDRARARDLHELRLTQFDLRDFLAKYLRKRLPAGVRSRSLSDVQSLINCLQLLNDRLCKAQPVEAIALVRRERARK